MSRQVDLILDQMIKVNIDYLGVLEKKDTQILKF